MMIISLVNIISYNYNIKEIEKKLFAHDENLENLLP